MKGIALIFFMTVFVFAITPSVGADELNRHHPESTANPIMKVCGIDIANPPFYRFTPSETPVYEKNQGIAFDLIEAASLNLGIHIQIIRLPWKRCLVMLKNGRVDGVIGASYTPERETYGHYPTTTTGQIDYSRIIYSNTYWLYSNDKGVSWDGKTLRLPLGGSVATGLGYSSGSLLRNLGVEYQQEYSPSKLIALLNNRRVSVIAGYAGQLEPFLTSQQQAASAGGNPVRKLPIPLSQDDMFLLISKPFYESQKDVAESIWRFFGEFHRNGSYSTLFNYYLTRYPAQQRPD
ncbi:MAG: transporter substrate-binding domain-containing protein [Motiliproteus sp.]